MSDLNVTAPPFAPTSANASDPTACDGADASHPAPPEEKTKEEEKEEEGEGEGAVDVASVDPTLALTVDAAMRSARENCALVQALCSLLTSTRGRVAQLEARLASLELELEQQTGRRRSGSSESERSWERAGADAPPTTPASPPEPSPVASGFAWADDGDGDGDSLPPPPPAPAPAAPALAAPAAARRPPAPPSSSPRTLAPHRSHTPSPTPTAEARASFSSVVEGPRPPTPNDDDAFPKLGGNSRDDDGDDDEDEKSAPGDGDRDVAGDLDERNADDAGFYDERVRGYEPAHHAYASEPGYADDGSDSVDPRNPVVNIIRLPDAFVERYLWDLPRETSHANGGSDDDDRHDRYDGDEKSAPGDGNEDDRFPNGDRLDADGFRSVAGPHSRHSHHRRDRTRGEVFARACAALSLLCEAVGLGVPASVKVKIRRPARYQPPQTVAASTNGERRGERMKFHASVRFATWTHEGEFILCFRMGN